MRIVHGVTLALLGALLSACGGGGSVNSTPSPSPPPIDAVSLAGAGARDAWNHFLDRSDLHHLRRNDGQSDSLFRRVRRDE